MLDLEDVVIIGAGPAGLQAAISAASELPRVVVIERSGKAGGQAGTSSHIENIAGYDESGAAITRRMERSALKHGARFVYHAEVTRVGTYGEARTVRLANGALYLAKAVILATGLRPRTLNIPGESTYIGKDIHYGSILPRVRACRGLPMTILGGANSAGQLALYAADFASAVNIIIRGETIESGMSDYLVRRIYAHPKIQVINHAEVQRVDGDERLRTVVYERHGLQAEVLTCALFICVGSRPDTSWLPPDITRDADGFVVADGELRHETKVPGIFVVGDVNRDSVKRIGGAIGQGTEVIPSLHRYLAGREFALRA